MFQRWNCKLLFIFSRTYFFPQANSNFLDWPQLSFRIFIYLESENKRGPGHHSRTDTKPRLNTAPWAVQALAPPPRRRTPLSPSKRDHKSTLHSAGWRHVLPGKALGTEAVTFGGYASSKDRRGWKAGALSSNFMWIPCDLTFRL